jgi:hypothetical protein
MPAVKYASVEIVPPANFVVELSPLVKIELNRTSSTIGKKIEKTSTRGLRVVRISP